MTARTISQVFDKYQKARLDFVQSVADLALKSNNIMCLESAGAVDLLCSLLTDNVPSIQHTAIIGLERLANHDIKLAETIVRKNILSQLLKNIDKKNKFYKRAVLLFMRSVAGHSPEMATIVISFNGLEALILCLEDFDIAVKQAAISVVRCIAKHNKNLARSIIDGRAIPLLVSCLQEPEITLKQLSAGAMCDISKHDSELAQAVVDAGAINFLAKALSNMDVKLKRQVLLALASIAKHSVSLAESVIESEIISNVLLHLAHTNEHVVKCAASLIKEICKHTLKLSEFITDVGGIGALLQILPRSNALVKIPAIMAIGYISNHSEQLAMAVIESKGIDQLALIFQEETDYNVIAVTVWAIGQIGKHGPSHANAIAESDVLLKILELYNSEKSPKDLKENCYTALKQILQKCLQIEALGSLLFISTPDVLKYILGQFSKVLPNDPKARRLFILSGSLKKVQEIKARPNSVLAQYIAIINCCFPEEIVRYCSPGYPDNILEAVEQYQPKCPSLTAVNREGSPETSQSSISLLDYDEEERAEI
ncbi:sperm-associated antigen 6-like isoform X1 [Prorops nasuta]|uniref:sperm-associated antigen 6-like isoform X1 n=1 Tax=Prorops nasuta TaxID=863751 RepID=UPI0034CF8C23